MDPAVAEYVNAIPPEHRALFDRIHRLILDTCPDATVVLSYKMPTYRVGTRRLHLGVWKHGVSLYGWKGQGDAGFTVRHPDLQTSTGTIRIRSDAGREPDDDLLAVVYGRSQGNPLFVEVLLRDGKPGLTCRSRCVTCWWPACGGCRKRRRRWSGSRARAASGVVTGF